MPIHDEIIYEVREDVLEKHIPQLVEVMKLDDLLMGHLGWKVGLECDAEYGENMRVEHNFFKEQEKKKAASLLLSPNDGSDVLINFDNNSAPRVADKKFDSSMGNDLEDKEPVFSEPVKEDGVELFSNVDESPFYDYKVKNKDKLAMAQTDSVWADLDVMENMGYTKGPKKRIRLIRDKVVIHKTMRAYSVDGFQALAIFLSL
jgi:hypothetical protein